jgi:uncharacterized protein
MATDFIRYDLLVQDALRSVVKKVLGDAARSGLPGEHHFNISFKTKAAGVTIPASMHQKYPDEMAIILQHQFWDLTIGADAFEVSLSFAGKPERLTIPFDSITGFSDPSVPFGFKLEPRLTAPLDEPAPARQPKPAPAVAAPPKAIRPASASPKSSAPAPVKPAEAPAKPVEQPRTGEAAKVVSIDAFRKK